MTPFATPAEVIHLAQVAGAVQAVRQVLEMLQAEITATKSADLIAFHNRLSLLVNA